MGKRKKKATKTPTGPPAWTPPGGFTLYGVKVFAPETAGLERYGLKWCWCLEHWRGDIAENDFKEHVKPRFKYEFPDF